MFGALKSAFKGANLNPVKSLYKRGNDGTHNFVERLCECYGIEKESYGYSGGWRGVPRCYPEPK
jgi:hypothetical protein